MGFDISAVNFLFFAKKKNVNFTKTLMLGRHSYQLNAADLQKCLEKNGRPAGEAAALLKEDPEYVEPFLRSLGAQTVHSMDASTYENATLVHDLNKPIPDEWQQQYDLVVDAGTLEHVFNFPQAISNAMQMVKPGGHFLSIQIANNFFGHGFYQFSPELFYRVLSPENGYVMEQMYFTTTRPFAPWYEVPDPKVVKSRVLLENSRQSYLLVLAKKTAHLPLFSTTPQQSDYEFIAWQQEGTQVEKSKGAVQSLAAMLPESLKNKIREWRKAIRNKRWQVITKDSGNGLKDFFRKVNN
ncbi:methyltransferase domain-containing protein [Chitinophaga sp. SYP-B3965]|uniref:class I SAM-dependent methyltransferase n=1 Tax=Chitinophaga sp. SYP-B3965 TaxID=2663120 RepID=UPI001299F401|nr:class I SAM-dependent methyltransferase [Chitinophaga sp. SYP-B3965]MRG44887.1 methyltransferase domain-containing protein [Chitinophaga sp. SYP-B3965]